MEGRERGVVIGWENGRERSGHGNRVGEWK